VKLKTENGTWSMLRVSLVALGCSVVVLVFGCFAVVQRARHFVVPIDDIEPAPIAIVLGAKVKTDGEPSDILRDRLLTAIDVYQRGAVEKLLLSGDDGQIEYDEVNAMRLFVLEHGVAPEDVFLDHAGFDTYDSMVRAKKIFGVSSAIVVTQDFHLPRALYLAQAEGIAAQGVSADRQTYLGILRYRLREIPASVKAVFSEVFHVAPTYLGETIDSAGDGRVTWDEQ
jgi:SanA protein